MGKLRTILVSLLTAALVGLGAAGCGHKGEHEHPQGEELTTAKPAEEKPAEQKSAEEAPAAEHPAGEHPSGEHPK